MQYGESDDYVDWNRAMSQMSYNFVKRLIKGAGHSQGMHVGMQSKMRVRLLAGVCVLLSACGLAMSSEERIERAEAAIAEREYQAASLDLKRVLQDEPNNSRARLLLGQTFLKMGDSAGSEAELRRAVSLGVPVADVQSELALSLWRQGKVEALLEDIVPDRELTSEALSEVLVLRGNAFLAVDAVLDARASYLGALEAVPDNVDASLGIVSSFVQGGDPAMARTEIDTLLEKFATNPQVWQASGSLYTTEQENEKAIEHFGKARDLAAEQNLRRQRLDALAGLVGVHLQAGDFDSAATSIAQYREISPNDLTGRVLDAQVQLARDDVGGAITELETVLKQAPTLGSANFLMGLAQFRSGKLGQSEAYFSAALQANPANALARKTLAEVRGKLRRSDSAESVLQPLLETGDTGALGLAARLRLDAGDYAGGIEYLRQRSEADPDNVAARLDYAAALISGGRAEEADVVLASVRPSATGTDALRGATLSVLTALAAEDGPRALLEAREAVAQFPEDPNARNLIGRVHQTLGDLQSARARYVEAIEIAPGDIAAYLNLAGLERIEGDLDAARGHLDAALEQDADSPVLLSGLAEIEAEAGNLDAAVSTMRRAVANAEDIAFPHIALGRLLLQTEAYGDAREAFETAASIEPNNAVPQNLLGFIAAQQDQNEAAIDAFRRAVRLAPEEPRYVLNLARAHAKAGRMPTARETLQEGFDEGLRMAMIVAPLATMMVSDGEVDEAIKIVERVEAPAQRDLLVKVLKGDIYMRAQLYSDAAREYGAAIDDVDDWRIATRLMSARRLAGLPEPEAALAEYVGKRPDNAFAHFALATFLQQSNRADEAVAEYEALLSNHPENAVALNNLAWLYNERGDARGLDMAARAVELAPESAAVIDTYGWILLTRERIDEGLEQLQRAMELNPEDPDIRYHVATALAQSGDADQARSLLETLLESDRNFASRADAEALLARL